MKYLFRGFELDIERRELLKQGASLSLPPKAFDLLTYLVENGDRMVSKRELLEKFWATNTTEAALLKSISLIRKVLGTNPDGESIIKTHHRQGYSIDTNIETSLESSSSTNGQLRLSEQRLGTILCIEFRYAACASHARHQEMQLLRSTVSCAQSIIEKHQGRLLNMMLEGFTAAFGLDQPYEDTTRRAIACAIELLQEQNEIEEEKEKLAISVGIDTGVMALHSECDAKWHIPDELERQAIELSRKANDNVVLLSTSSLEQVPGEIETKSTPDGFELVSRIIQRSGTPSHFRMVQSRFVGRQAELAFIDIKLKEMMLGQGSAVVLSGSPGIGKTRLMSEALRNKVPDSTCMVVVSCLPGLTNTPLALIRKICQFMEEQIPPLMAVDNKVEQALWRNLCDDTANESVAVLKEISEQERRQRSHALIDQGLVALCEKHATVLSIEDIHWVDASSKEFLHHIIRNVENKRMMCMMTTRPVDSTPLTDTVLNLAPLNQVESSVLLRNIPLVTTISPKTTELLIGRAAGNPFFLEELAFAAQSGADPKGKPPRTVNAVIQSRIAALPIDVRTVVYIMAVIGPSAPLALIAHLADESVQQIRLILSVQISEGLIVEDLDNVSFRHMLFNDAAYSMLSRFDRKRLHSQIAEYLESGSLDEWARPERLAWHFQEAQQIHQAITYWVAACRTALKQSSHHETITFAEKGLALIDPTNSALQKWALDLHLMMANSLIVLNGFSASRAGKAYQDAQTINNEVGCTKSAIRILVGLWIHNWVKGDLRKSLDYANRLMNLTSQSDHSGHKIQAHASIGQVEMHLGRLPDALSHLRKGMAYINEHPPGTLPEQNAATACASYAAWASSLIGLSTEARQYYQMSLKLSLLYRNPFAEAIHFALGAGYLMTEGDVDHCLECANNAVSVSRKHDFNFWLGTGLVVRGWALGQAKHVDALKSIDEGIDVFEATGAGVQLANWYGLKAETQLAAGLYSEGLESATRALNFAHQTDDVFFTPHIHAVAAELHAALENPGLSDKHALKADKLAQEFGIASKTIILNNPNLTVSC